jgi:hypothetical protein
VLPHVRDYARWGVIPDMRQVLIVRLSRIPEPSRLAPGGRA